MRDFIVWDSKWDIFLSKDNIEEMNELLTDEDDFYYSMDMYLTCADLLFPKEEQTYNSIKDRFTFHEDIELKDINDKPIYADCSIVQFNWGQDMHNIKGYFTYNKEYLQYEIIMLNAQKGKSLAYMSHTCSNLKVIDTIQENKLGLIK